ncbi:hypothetical protein D9757_012807 [Collybiopsis confluens]|uniref:Putative lipoate-protein ligase A n=1 Tax=Collybiopsis confluens TaxID=2823264 RepID=A0A8H5LQI4_9AGAR|nr:hypothetical protein D9757_012807 [Collybiopsis confluens]
MTRVWLWRNQNPWKEVNFVALNEQRIPWIRRRSGGGTVYHDLGNTNFSVHLPRAAFDRHMTAQVVLRAVQPMGIPALTWFLSLLLPSHFHLLIAIRFALLHVSGSAYKIVNKRAYHHGTMLISTKLNTLGEVLKPGKDKDAMETKGVASVRSPVRNLQQSYEEVTHDRFVQAVAKAFREEYGVDSEGTGEIQVIGEKRYRDVEYIQKGINELKSWEWAYGQTPEFTYTIQKDFNWGIVRAKIRSKHGIILDCDCSVDHSLSFDDMSLRPGNVSDANTQNEMEKISTLFRGRKYGVSGSRVEGSGVAPQGPVITYQDIKLATPAAPALFAGREDITKEAVENLLQVRPAHFAILGAGGMGKSTLALHIIKNAEVIKKFQDKIFFVPCEICLDATSLIHAVVQSLRLQVQQGKNELEVLDICFARAQTPILLVLDNFETPWNGTGSQNAVVNFID